MPNPKRRHSQARTNKRRAHDYLTPFPWPNAPIATRRSCPTRRVRIAAIYKGREVIDTAAKTA